MPRIARISKAAREAKSEAFERGRYLGQDFAGGFERFVFSEGEGEYVNRDGETVGQYVEAVFENYSQYSPWEQTASYWNSFIADSDDIWAAFYKGLADGCIGVDSGD